MSEHEIATKKQEKTDSARRDGVQDHQLPSQSLLAWDISSYLIANTPYKPNIQKHVDVLSNASSEQVAVISRQLQQAYGNRYIQRLVESIQVKPEGPTSSYKEESTTKEKQYRNVRPLAEYSSRFFTKSESPTFNKVFEQAIKLQVRIAPDPQPGSRDLASYDPLNNVMWIPKSELQKASNTEEFKRTITHELVHALQYRAELQATKDPKMRQQKMEQQASSLTEDEYIDMKWKRELQAEKIAWTAYHEAINEFAKSRPGGGFPSSFLKEITDTRVREFAEQNRDAYRQKFKQAYRKLTRKTEERNSVVAPKFTEEIARQLQQTNGNRHVQRLVQPMRTQANRTVNQPDDMYEQEADTVAETVTRFEARPDRLDAQRQAEEHDELRSKAGLHRQPDDEEELRTKSGGCPLPDSVRASLETTRDPDLGQVRIPSELEACKLSSELGVKAFSTGQGLTSQEGAQQPELGDGFLAITHELTRVVQQGQDRNTPNLQRQETAHPRKGVDYEFDLKMILGPKPKYGTLGVTEEQLLGLYKYLKSVRRVAGATDPSLAREMQEHLEGYFPGFGKQAWEESKKPFAGYVGTAFGAQARKRLDVAKGRGLSRSQEKRLKKRLIGSDVVFFSGHHFARYGSPGEFEAVDLRNVRFVSTRSKLLLISSCAGIASNSVALFRRKFPNAYILGWRFGSPLNQKGIMREFVARLPEDLSLEGESAIEEIVRDWRAYVESLAVHQTSVKPAGLGYATPDGIVTYYVKRRGEWQWIQK